MARCCLNLANAVAAQGRNHERVRKRESAVEPIGELEKLRRLNRVNLVQHQNLDAAHARQASKDGLDFFIHAFPRVHEQGDDVGVAGAAPSRRHHGPIEPPLGCEDSGRIHKNDLRRILDGNATYRAACRLHLA